MEKVGAFQAIKSACLVQQVDVMAKAVGVDRNEIEAAISVDFAGCLEILPGGALHGGELRAADGFFRDIASGASLLNFHEDENFLVEDDDVDFTVAGLVTSSDDCVAQVEQELCGPVFGFLS